MIEKKKPGGLLGRMLSNLDKDSLRRTRDKMCIATKIADAIKANNLTQKEFAIMMKKTESEISDWLSGNRNFTVDTLSDIGNALGISLLTPYVKFHCISSDSKLAFKSNKNRKSQFDNNVLFIDISKNPLCSTSDESLAS